MRHQLLVSLFTEHSKIIHTMYVTRNNVDGQCIKTIDGKYIQTIGGKFIQTVYVTETNDYRNLI